MNKDEICISQIPLCVLVGHEANKGEIYMVRVINIWVRRARTNRSPENKFSIFGAMVFQRLCSVCYSKVLREQEGKVISCREKLLGRACECMKNFRSRCGG